MSDQVVTPEDRFSRVVAHFNTENSRGAYLVRVKIHFSKVLNKNTSCGFSLEAPLMSIHYHMSRDVRKQAFCICENKDADQLRGNREADQRLCFRYMDSKSLYYLHPKFQASSHLLWPYSPACVGPSRKPRRPVFSERGSFGIFMEK